MQAGVDARQILDNEARRGGPAQRHALQEISRRIEAIQTDTRGAVKTIAEISTVIGKINEYSSVIACAVEEQSATTGEIGGNMTEAATRTSEIARNIATVDQAAHSTTSGAEDTQVAAGQLAMMAADLQKLVGRFVC